MTFQLWLALFSTALIVSLAPGSTALNTISHVTHVGFCRTLTSILGIEAGGLIQILLVLFGLGALLESSHWAFLAVKWLGVLYLTFLGLQMWLRPTKTIPERGEIKKPTSNRCGHLFTEGFMVSLLSVDNIVFFLAIIPQFINRSEALLPQYLIITTTFLVADMLIQIAYAQLAGRAIALLSSQKACRIMDRTFGAIYFLVAIILCLTQSGIL